MSLVQSKCSVRTNCCMIDDKNVLSCDVKVILITKTTLNKQRHFDYFLLVCTEGSDELGLL